MLLNWLREFKEMNEEDYARIKRMPARSRVGRKSTVKKDSTLTYIRNKHRHGFYFVKPDGSFEELTFVEAAREFKASTVEKGVPLHTRHYEQVTLASGTVSGRGVRHDPHRQDFRKIRPQ